jgi:hypothetical protein
MQNLEMADMSEGDDGECDDESTMHACVHKRQRVVSSEAAYQAAINEAVRDEDEFNEALREDGRAEAEHQREERQRIAEEDAVIAAAMRGEGEDERAEAERQREERQRIAEEDAVIAAAMGGGKEDETAGLCAEEEGKRCSRPDWLPAPKDTLRYAPLLSPKIAPEKQFYEGKTSFKAIYGSRCVAGEKYSVPGDFDGLSQYLRATMDEQLEAWMPSLDPDPQRLIGILAKRLRCGRGPEAPEVTMQLPQLFHCAEKHELMLHGDDPVVHGGRLCGRDGDQFVALRVGAAMPTAETGFRLSDGGAGCQIRMATSSLSFKWPDAEMRFVKGPDGATLSIETFDCEDRVGDCDLSCHAGEIHDDVPLALTNVLDSSTWLYRDVRSYRRKFAVSHSLELDPLDQLMLECVVDPEPHLVAELLRFLSSGRFRSAAHASSKGDQFELMSCGENGLWSVDRGKTALAKLGKRLQVNMSQLEHSEDFDALCEDLDRSGKLEATKQRMKREQELEEEPQSDQVRDELQRMCRGFGALGLRKEIKGGFDAFVRLVHDQSFEYDALRQVNFADGWCYDPGIKSVRRIRPSDGATLSTGYPLPEFDDAKDAELEVFLIEVHPDGGVRAFRVSELAKCLDMAQTAPMVRLVYGSAGAGKGLSCNLFLTTFGGDYSLEADKALFGKQRADGGEGASPLRMKLKNKLYVNAHEIPGFDGDSVKAWCGSGKITARDLYGAPETFSGTFNLTEFTFNDMISIKKDDGLERRVCAIKCTTQFVECKDDAEAAAKQAQWHEDGETGKATICKEKAARIEALAPQLMARLIRIHQSGAYVERYPAEVEKCNAALWAEAAPQNPCQEPMSLWYQRCGCSPRDPADQTTADLVDNRGLLCSHKVKGCDIVEKLKTKLLDDGSSLYKKVKGRGRTDEPVWKMLERVRMGPDALKLVRKERDGDDRNVFFGIVPCAFGRLMAAQQQPSCQPCQ